MIPVKTYEYEFTRFIKFSYISITFIFFSSVFALKKTKLLLLNVIH